MNLLANAKWMDKETRNSAANKLRNLDMTVGYPYWQTNKTFINHYYGNVRNYLFIVVLTIEKILKIDNFQL